MQDRFLLYDLTFKFNSTNYILKYFTYFCYDKLNSIKGFMRKNFLLLALCGFLAVNAYGENMKTIKTSKAGSLSTKISEKKLSKVTDLSISGPINREDIAYLRSVLKSHKTINTLNLKSAEGLDEIMDGGFAGCSSITAFILPSTINKIGQSAFEDCSELNTLLLPDNVKSIGDKAFKRCSKLTNLNYPTQLKRIGKNAFQECYNISSVELANIDTIGAEAFKSCNSILNITLPNEVKHIGKNAFDGCSSLTSFTIPFGIEKIEDFLFWNCSKLKNSNKFANIIES